MSFVPTHVGIDLGTTFCCQAYIDENSTPVVIPSAEGEQTIPSVIWYDGQKALVGKKANDRKVGSPQHVYEFVKRDIGKPTDPSKAQDGEELLEAAPYNIGGYPYGSAGMSGIILRKLKRDALRYFKRKGYLGQEVEERSFYLRAVITVPAYFGERQRRETRLAGEAAGIEVIGMINEPTAAALSYGLVEPNTRQIMVFDLGGGTFDVTVLRMQHGKAEAVATGGDSKLGGKDWDALVQSYLYEVYRKRTGKELDDDFATSFDIQQKALEAKFALTEQDETSVQLTGNGGDLDIVLHRAPPAGGGGAYAMNQMSDAFYFERRATELMSRCRALCVETLERVPILTPGGAQRPMTWRDLDEIVIAGGSSRMPMVPAMLEREAGRNVRRQIPGFNYDTAIASGAAIFGQQLVNEHKSELMVIDILSHTIGIEVIIDGHRRVSPLLYRDTRLPTQISRTFLAPASAALNVYEGDSILTDECAMRGTMQLQNAEGQVEVTLTVDTEAILVASVRHLETGVTKVLEIKHPSFKAEHSRRSELAARVQAITFQS